MTVLALGLIAVILVGPGPLWVGRWGFLYRVPRATIVLWQAGTVAALISVFGAGLVIGLRLLDRWSPSGPTAQQAFEVAGYAVVVLFTTIVLLRLSWSLVSVVRSTGARRRRHRHAVDLLGQIDPGSPLPGLRILAETLPLAYCLPSARGSRVVLSKGTLATLKADELTAVLEHESAHLRARHDVVLDSFSALHRAFPIFVRSEIPHQQCRLLVEMLADDAARRRVGAVPLARALVAMASSPVPNAALGVSQHGTVARLERLSGPSDYSRPLAAAVYALAAGLVLLPTAVLLL